MAAGAKRWSGRQRGWPARQLNSSLSWVIHLIENDEVKGLRRAYMLEVVGFNLIPDLMPPPEEFGIVPACDCA